MSEAPDSEADRSWAELVSPARRGLLLGTGAAAGLAAFGSPAAAAQENASGLRSSEITPVRTSSTLGRSPWGYATVQEPTPRPISVRPGETDLPSIPRAYSAIRSYHAHVYFDEDSYAKAVRLRQWVSERFTVELGNWNLEPRGPHVTPSFYFGFVPEQLAVIVPWLQLNSLGLTILLHPNTDDPRADHLHYALWVNRAQPVNAYGMRTPLDATGHPLIEQIFPNTTPTLDVEV